MKHILNVCIIFTCLILPAHVHAQTGLSTNSDEPVEITADKTLEWRRAENQFAATGNALAQQGTASIAAETLIADYRKTPASSMEVYYLEATQNVILSSQDSKAYGDKAQYDLDKGLATMTGKDLKLVSPDQTITAQDRFEYYIDEGRANAIGRAKVIRPKIQGGVDTLEADKISAFFTENASGKQELEKMEARGNVIITTPTEVITGAYAKYTAASNKANLNGGVTIRRGQNILEGDRAVVDLTTNLSQIFASEKTGQRVRGVFFPGSEKKPEE